VFDLEKSKTANALDFDTFTIRLASPETIRNWSYGEVLKPETINYRTFKPEKGGLFCERIFGPVKDYECNCGKYRHIRYKGIVCDRCGVEVTHSKVRRERMGHIELAVPIAHIWYFKSVPSRLRYFLEVSVADLERLLYYESYVVIDPGTSGLKKMDIISDEEYLELEQGGKKFIAKMGAEAIRDLLKAIDVDELATELRVKIRVETSEQKKNEMLKRLKIIEAFRQSGNKPEWMIMEVIPVIPPDLRPLVPLEGGRFATSDLNDLYRRLINRNNRLKKMIEIKSPEVILRNEKRMLQEAVDSLFDNGRQARAVKGTGNRPLKSLSDLLRGKQGRFRQNLLGKRVDYSGRSVIVVGPELKLHQCGLPKIMALELFKPHIIRELEERGIVQTVKAAKKYVEKERPEVYDILEEITRDHPVLLNRAPTLHRLGVQAFQPVLVEGKALRIHPLVCAAFNADFDGDQMAVHVPLTYEAQIECHLLMRSTNNILSPASGRPLAVPSQDIVLGLYYLTKEEQNPETDPQKLRALASLDEVIFALEHKVVRLHQRIRFRFTHDLIDTTPGKVIFNAIVPPEMGYIGELMSKGKLTTLVGEVYRKLGNERTVELLDKMKDLGFRYATIGGFTVGIDDLLVPEEKEQYLTQATREAGRIVDQYRKGVITDGERYNKIIDIWTHTTSNISEIMFAKLRGDRGGFNPVFMMADSGARGSQEQIRQLAGMRGLMAKPQKKLTGQVGEIIESPITSNFCEGLTVLEYFISTHGARKGLADTALKTAEAGYLTRKLADVAQDVVTTMEDCGTIMGVNITALKEGEDIIEPLYDRILGRVALEDVVDPISGEVLAKSGEEINEEAARNIERYNIEMVPIRSVLTCEARRGLCAKCYGRDLSNGKMVCIENPVGVIAAQSIGEPGTQLTLRTFHIGGVASSIATQSEVKVKSRGVVRFEGLKVVKRPDGKEIVINRNGRIFIADKKSRKSLASYEVPYGAVLKVHEGDDITKEDTVVYEWDPHSTFILTDVEGTIAFSDLKDGITFKEERDERGFIQQVLVEAEDRSLSPSINVLDDKGVVLKNFLLPIGAYLMMKDGDKARVGDALYKKPSELSKVKTRDITGGLPRVAELFEARLPKEPAIVSEIDGYVTLGRMVRGSREITVKGVNDTRKYLIPYGKHLLVHDGDRVRAGERLSEGPINPHDILNILGVKKVQEYLVNEIQEVYRLQGVRINDKHVEIIVRQMLQKVKVQDPGDTNYLEGEQVDKFIFFDENEKVIREGGTPATYQPLLLGVTKSVLNTNSFIAAASFQETTRVLTEAATQGKSDPLVGLKENLIIGHLISAGTGAERFKNLSVAKKEQFALETEPEEESIANH
jgi:DNA-directed RNA polymerase subunit beta'